MSSWAEYPRLEGVRVLVVEAVPNVRDLVTDALEQFGAEVIAVGSAPGALGLVKRERPDVIVSSLRMPEKDGYWLIRRLRSMSADHGGRTPAIAFTGCTTKEDRINGLRASLQRHVPKSAVHRYLARLVALWILRRESVLV